MTIVVYKDKRFMKTLWPIFEGKLMGAGFVIGRLQRAGFIIHAIDGELYCEWSKK